MLFSATGFELHILSNSKPYDMKNGLRQFALLTVMLWASLSAFASDAFEVGGIYYRISGSTEVEVTAAPKIMRSRFISPME